MFLEYLIISNLDVYIQNFQKQIEDSNISWSIILVLSYLFITVPMKKTEK